MDIVSRIKFFLNYRGIASSQFADTCEIPRPTVSQLLNGRNKKVSDEVISKIHNAYPELSIMWLMFGEEPMIVNSENKLIQPKVAENLKIESNSESMSIDENLKPQDEKRILFFNDTEVPQDISNDSENKSSQIPISRVIENFARSVEHNDVNTEKSGEKHIVNVMVFYSDNSFVSFVPEKR